MRLALVIVLLGLISSIAAEESAPSAEITRFPLNTPYGISKTEDSVATDTHKYYLYKFDRDASGTESAVRIDSILAWTAPQLCDSNAVSFTVRTSPDSAMLMVKGLDSSKPRDTIIAYPIETFGGKYSTGQERLYNLGRYLYTRTDSLLFWVVPYPTKRFWEIGRILPNRLYQTIDPGRQTGSPCFSGDFSMVLFADHRELGWLGFGLDSDLGRTDVVAYDLNSDSSYILRSLVGICGSPQLHHRDGQLFCTASPSLDISSVCIVEDSIPRALFTIEYPVSFSGYDVHQDSVVIRTANCCDKDYGVKTHVVRR